MNLVYYYKWANLSLIWWRLTNKKSRPRGFNPERLKLWMEYELPAPVKVIHTQQNNNTPYFSICQYVLKKILTFFCKENPHKHWKIQHLCGLSVGSPNWARTSDIMINSHALYRLSYGGIYKSWHFPIFPGCCHPSIFGTIELNFCVRDGNRCTLNVSNTNYLSIFKI